MKPPKLLILIAPILLYGCSAIYTCSESRPTDFRAGKRVMDVVNERDSICTELAASQAHNELLGSSLEAEKAAHANLRDRYDQLKNESAKTNDELNAELLRKSDEIHQKELALRDREKTLKELQSVIARQDSITKRLNNILRDALLGFQADELSVEVKNGKVYVSMSDKLLFKSGSASVEAKGSEAITTLAGVLEKNPEIEILIEGHTDNVPIKTSRYKDNWDLSADRATSIVRLLESNAGIAPQRLTAAGRGEFMPKATNDTAEGRAQNRRTEIILSPKLDELMNLLGN